jgi:hypothetical protein
VGTGAGSPATDAVRQSTPRETGAGRREALPPARSGPTP